MLNAKGKIRNFEIVSVGPREASASHSSFHTEVLKDVATVHR